MAHPSRTPDSSGPQAQPGGPTWDGQAWPARAAFLVWLAASAIVWALVVASAAAWL